MSTQWEPEHLPKIRHPFVPSEAFGADVCGQQRDDGVCLWGQEEHEGAWTFFGHWDEGSLVFEYIREGVHEDDRIDTGYWEQGLFAASGYGSTMEEAEQAVRAQYEPEHESAG